MTSGSATAVAASAPSTAAAAGVTSSSARGAETYFLSPDPTDREAKALADVENEGAAPVSRALDAVSGILADLALGQARNDSAHLAEIVQRHLVRDARVGNRGVRQAPFVVLAGTKMPSALVEIGFISHPLEGRMLGKERHQRAIARALAAAVQEYADEVLARRLVASRAHVVLPEVVLVGKKPQSKILSENASSPEAIEQFVA